MSTDSRPIYRLILGRHVVRVNRLSVDAVTACSMTISWVKFNFKQILGCSGPQSNTNNFTKIVKVHFSGKNLILYCSVMGSASLSIPLSHVQTKEIPHRFQSR